MLLEVKYFCGIKCKMYLSLEKTYADGNSNESSRHYYDEEQEGAILRRPSITGKSATQS